MTTGLWKTRSAAIAVALLAAAFPSMARDPLPSWNDGPTGHGPVTKTTTSTPRPRANRPASKSCLGSPRSCSSSWLVLRTVGGAGVGELPLSNPSLESFGAVTNPATAPDVARPCSSQPYLRQG